MPRKGMFDTPPPAMIKTRGALEREKLKHAAEENSEVKSQKACTAPEKEELNDHAQSLPAKASSFNPPTEEGSFKARSGALTSISTTKSSLLAQKRQLELDAAEAKAKIEKELIDKRLAAELAALEDEQSQRSRSRRCSEGRSSISGPSQKVEKWLQKSLQDDPLEPAHVAPEQTLNFAAPTGDFHHLAQAMEKLATATQKSNTQLLSRLATSKDLPIFSGESLEWIQFKKSYDQSTKLCNYSDSENMARLDKCLRGEARETVSSLLTSDSSPSIILEALELRFGRPDLIINKILLQLKKLPPLPQAYHTELVNFAVKVKNYVAAAQSIKQIDHLRSPELLNIVISKCPSPLINKWADFIYEKCDPAKTKLQLFSEFLHKEATKIAAAGVTHIHSQGDSNYHKFPKKVEERKIPVYSVLNNDSDCNTKCKFCRTASHSLSSCIKFKRALRKNKWHFVRINKYCHKCLLPGHGKETCPAAPCDVDGCGLPHHRLLHWPTKLNPAAAPFNPSCPNEDLSATSAIASTSQGQGHNLTSETVTNTIVGPGTSVMLKIVRVNVHGPSGIISTDALLDDGATVSLISADLANSVNLQGQQQTLSIKGAWNSSIVCKSEVVNFKLSNINNEIFDMRARKISELDLPTQTYSKVNLDAYEHLRNLKGVLKCGIVKPKLLIGQDNFHLIMSLQTVYRGKNEPCATLTPLGWCLHGIVPASAYIHRHGKPLTTEHALTTTLYERAPPAATVYVASVAPALATPAVTCTAQHETHTCEGAHMYPAQQWPADALINSEDTQLHELVRRSFALESIGVNSKPRVNKDDIRAVSIIDNSARLINGNYEISLPWKNDLKMPDSYPAAYKRFRNVERKLMSNEDYAKRYKERIDHLLDNNYARALSEDELSASHRRVWYLPHFGVNNDNKKKLRLVFDAAATTAGCSLNDYLLQGPDLLQSLLGIMLRFREKPIAIMGDIKDYFLRIKIEEEDQHALRFLWRDDVNSELKTYVMTSLIFGANCSPFVAQHIKNLNAMRFQDEMPEATEAILKSHYMDDYIESVDNERLAVKMIKEVSEIHTRGGFQIRNWISNKQEVLECTPKETLSDKAIRIKTGCDDLPERTLGLLWFPASDTFGFDLSLKRIPPEIINLQRKPTKRELLRIYMSIFDIFGFLTPFTVKAKIMLQNIWKTDIKWDDEIPANEYNIFTNWLIELQALQCLRIPRYYFRSGPHESERDGARDAGCSTSRESETTIQLHVFCDASPTAYAAVAYWRKEYKNKDVCVSFIASKCRASPVKKYITIPKLELQAAVIACRLADTIARENRLTDYDKFFWTDSLIVLHQIRNDTRNYKVFVANRLGEIDELSRSHEWNYVPTNMNIADKATKLNTYKLSNDCDWLRGPDFLYLPREQWPKHDPETQRINNNELLVNTIHTPVNEDLPAVPDPAKFSSWIRLWRCMANVLLFITRCRKPRNAQINSEVMQRAETELLRYSQMKSFPEEIYSLKNNMPIDSRSRLRKLTPFLDEYGLLRVGGRIDAASGVEPSLKRPVILDGHDQITKLIIHRYHVMAAHGNNETVVNDVRQKYWIINLRPAVRKAAARCLYCRIRRVNPANPRMGDLPEGRLAHHQRPFTHCGVDLFGHMEVTIGRRHEKSYGVLFTCMTVRAIHIEIVPSLSADSFIMALRRMAARRGWPHKMYSDNGTNFRGAEAELRRSFKEISLQPEVKQFLTICKLEWHFISPASPNMGGAWERLIQVVKAALKPVLKERAPREEVLATLLAEVENIVNGRPLSYVSVNHGDPESLTPNHFFIGSSSNLSAPGQFCDSDLYRKKMWRITQRLTDFFWQRWMREVLPTMLPRQRWYQEGNQLKKGDVVVIVDPAMPRNVWPKGLVHEVHPGADGRVRIVDVKTKVGILTRPVSRLALLPTADDDCP